MSETIMFGNDTLLMHDITTYYHARVVADSLEIGGTPITNTYIKGRNRTNYIYQTNELGLKPIKFRVCFQESTVALCEDYKTTLLGDLMGVKEISLPDGYFYRSMLKKIGKEEWLGSENNGGVLLLFDLEFEGIQHKRLIYVADGRNEFTAQGTMPKMDCQLVTVAGSATSHYYVFGADFGAVSAGDVLTFDGIEKRMLKNGSPTSINGYFEFPYVVAGANQFTGDDPITVAYYPCFI